MNTAEKGRTDLKKVFRIIFYLGVILFITVLSGAYLFVKSPSFTKHIEQIINSRSERPIKIGSISLKKGREIVIKDMVIQEHDGTGPLAVFPYVKINISFQSLLGRGVEAINVKRPKIFLTLEKDRAAGTPEVRPSLPFSFKTASIEDGEIVLQSKESRSFHVIDINLSLKGSDDGKTGVKGSIFLKEPGLTVPVEAVLDMDRLSIEKGHLDVTIREIDSLFIKTALPGDAEIRGTVRLDVDIHRTDRLGVQLSGRFSNIMVKRREKPLLENASGRLRALFLLSKDYQGVEIRAQGIFSNPLWGREDSHKIVFNGEYNVKKRELSIGNTSLTSSLLGPLSIEGSLKNIPSQNPGIVLTVKGRTIPLHKVKKVLTGRLAELIDGVGAEGYGRVDVSIAGRLKGPRVDMEAEAIYQNIDLEKTAGRLPFLFAEKGFTVGGKGELRSTFILTIPEGAGPSVKGRAGLSIAGGSFSSADAEIAGENININVSGSFEFSLPLDRAEFAVSAKASDFELLWGSFYGSFKDRDIGISLKGSYNREQDLLVVSQSVLDMTDMGAVSISGEIRSIDKSPRFTANISLRELVNKNAYDFFIRETFQEKFAFLSQLETGGMTSMKLSLNGGAERFNIRGEMSVEDMYILNRDAGLSVQGINISMPVDITCPDVSFYKEAERFGSLKVRDISMAEVHLKDLEVFPAVWQNALVFKEDVSVPLFGGAVKLTGINFKNLLKPERKLSLSVSIKGIELNQLSRALGIPAFSGRLSGSIPRADIAGGSLSTEGEIVMEFFGGELRAGNLAVNNIFGPVPSVKTSVEIKDIDLGRLTETFEFGHISGVLQGYVKNLVIANGQAESFEAVIETVEKEDVGQKISVEALEKISILGSGSSAAALSRGVYKFFKQYKYKKMGFRGKLKNDKFLLLGVETEGDREYIVKGGLLPPRVNVISYTQYISFQEMVKRLKRVKQAGRTRENS